MYEVAPSILESRLLGSNNIVDAAVVGIPDKENGQVKGAVRQLWDKAAETALMLNDKIVSISGNSVVRLKSSFKDVFK